MRRAVPFLTMLLVAFAAGPVSADMYECQMDGRTWYTNHKKPGARCRLVLKDFGSPAPAAERQAAQGNGSATTKKRPTRTWKPPRKVTFDQAAADEKVKEISRIVALASKRYNLPEAFIHAVITVESSYKVRALSYKGAMGLMQLMPGTAADMGVDDPYDPYQNVMGGTRFLRILANRFNGDIPKTIAAFHSGGGAVTRAGGIAYQGSDGYVRKVLDNYYRLKKEMAALTPQ